MGFVTLSDETIYNSFRQSPSNDNKSDDELKQEVEFYKNLGGCLGYDEEHHRYCVGLCKYESKPVISFICISDKLCSIDSIPEWMYNEFDIVMLDLKY